MGKSVWYRRRPLWLFIPLIGLPVLYASYNELYEWWGDARQVTQLGLALVLFLVLTILAAFFAVLLFKGIRRLTGGNRSALTELAEKAAKGEEE